jgi:hypothetical protein
LVDGVSDVEASTVFNNTTWKVINDGFKYVFLVSIDVYYTPTSDGVVDRGSYA